MSKTQNIIDKIWESHVVHREEGAPDVLFIDCQLLHEVTTPQAFELLRQKGLSFFDSTRAFATIDHSIPSDDARSEYPDKIARKQVEQMRKNCEEFGVTLFDVGSGSQGIVHTIGPELGITQPGRTMVCGDSHTSTHGAFGALAFGIGTTQIAHVMTTQCLLLHKPKTMKVDFVGTPSTDFTAKDAILALIRQIGIQGGTGHAIEFCGDFIRDLSMEARMTICNMAIECGATSGLISPDETTFAYLQGRDYVPKDFEKAVSAWKTLASDDSAMYDSVIEIDINGLLPQITWGTNPEQVVSVDELLPQDNDWPDEAHRLAAQKAYDYVQLTPGQSMVGVSVDYVFLGSCTNGRIEDFRVAAEVLKGKKIAEHITMYAVPGSERVYQQCQKEGIDVILKEAGAQFRQPGCSMCLAMNGDLVPAGKRCASTSNRNFVGRQGSGSITHLMSPLMVAQVALNGCIKYPF